MRQPGCENEGLTKSMFTPALGCSRGKGLIFHLELAIFDRDFLPIFFI